MARVALIAAVMLAFLLQLASSQSAACQNAAATFRQNIGQCTPTNDNPLIICDPPCRGYYITFINTCGAEVEVSSKL